MQSLFTEADLIDVYTRQQAIEDGVLIDVTETAREAGIRFPVALTSALFESLNPTDEDSKHGQDFTGRLWDVFTIFKIYARQGGSCMTFHIKLWRAKWPDNGPKLRNFFIKAMCGPGDNAEPVLTFMLPNED